MDAETKIERVKEIVTKWALSDESPAVDALIRIMETLEFDPYEAAAGAGD